MPAKSQPGPPARGRGTSLARQWAGGGDPKQREVRGHLHVLHIAKQLQGWGGGGATRTNTPRAAPSTSRRAEKDRIWKILISKISEVRLVLGDPCFVKKSGFGQAAKRDLKQPTSSALRTGGSHGAECSPE